MPEEPEIDLDDLREKIEEVEEAENKKSAWIKSISLSTAILAVFAAVGALQAGSLVNEAMVKQLKASDTWNEYQSSKEKTHQYTIAQNAMLDSGLKLPAVLKREEEYKGQLGKEDTKEQTLSEKAKKLEEESEAMMKKHEIFAFQVAIVQVAIAIGAVSALTKVRWFWYCSIVLGVAGIVLFFVGFGH